MQLLLSDCFSLTPTIFFKGLGTSKWNTHKQPEIQRGRGEGWGEKSKAVEGRMERTDIYVLYRACKCWNPFWLSVALSFCSNLCYWITVTLEELWCGCLVFSAFVFWYFCFFFSEEHWSFLSFCAEILFLLKTVTLRRDNEDTLMYKHKNGCKMLFHLLVCCLFFYTDE